MFIRNNFKINALFFFFVFFFSAMLFEQTLNKFKKVNWRSCGISLKISDLFSLS